MSMKIVLGALAALAASSGTAFATVTIADSSFEATIPSSYTYNPTVTGAAFVGGSGEQVNGSAWGFANAPDGVQTAFLQNISSFSLDVSGLQLGGKYTFSFKDSLRPGYGTLPYLVSFNGAQIGSFTPASTSWASQTTSLFTAHSTSGLLTFATNIADGDHDTGIDQITIAGGVPEPATWAMMLLGFLGVGMAMRSSRPKTTVVI